MFKSSTLLALSISLAVHTSIGLLAFGLYPGWAGPNGDISFGDVTVSLVIEGSERAESASNTSESSTIALSEASAPIVSAPPIEPAAAINSRVDELKLSAPAASNLQATATTPDRLPTKKGETARPAKSTSGSSSVGEADIVTSECIGPCPKSSIGDRTDTASRSIGGQSQGQNSGGLVPLHLPKPPYPLEARRAGFEGVTTLDLLIAANGRVVDAKIAKPSGRVDCDAAAQETAVKHWRFRVPSHRASDTPIPQQVAVVFELR